MLQVKIISSQGALFNIEHIKQKHFDMPWHYHPEYELVYIVRGYGRKSVGDASILFSEGDLSLIGPDVPHYFEADDIFYQDNDLYCEWYVIQFTEGVLPRDYKVYELFIKVHSLLKDSCFGVDFDTYSVQPPFSDFFPLILNDRSINQLMHFYNLLIKLSENQSRRLLNSCIHVESSVVEDPIIRKVHNLLLHNFKNEITLRMIAEAVYMQPSALCTYYKRHTLRTIFDTLTDIRISYAARLLVNTNLPIYQVADESGFLNISNFNRHFLKIKKMIPREYRRYYKRINGESQDLPSSVL